MSDPVFRKQAEALATLLENDEYRDAFAFSEVRLRGPCYKIVLQN